MMVKVLPKDSNSLRSVSRHLSYIGRDGNLILETDDGERVQGKHAGQWLLENWDLDLDEHRKQMGVAPVSGRSPKLVHKIVLSMPPGTRARGVLEAARKFAREEFALAHRYALVLHADAPHPHVHIVVKAVSEEGIRLNIRKATLQEWRRSFAQYLRDLGIEANATERAVRGKANTRKTDGVHRAIMRGDSIHMRRRVTEVARELAEGQLVVEPGKRTILETRREITAAWFGLADRLDREGHRELAAAVRGFVRAMPPPRTEKEGIADRLRGMSESPSIGARTP